MAKTPTALPPKVLLLGDSIRMSYQPLVRERLADVAEVVGPDENCAFTLFTLARLEKWLATLGSPDVVHWNNGLHDAGYNPARSPLQIPIEIYRMALEFILDRLEETGARIIWATTTPVHPERPMRDDQWSWTNRDIEAYNAAALELMQARGIDVNDLYGLVMREVAANLAEDQLHLSEVGKDRCAQAVAAAVRERL